MSDSTNPMDRSRKRVRIAENPSEVVALVESLSDQERMESWYSSSEFAASKDSVKELCRSYRQSRRYSDCLTQAYKTACGLADQPEEVPEPKPPNPGETEVPDEVRMSLQCQWNRFYHGCLIPFLVPTGPYRVDGRSPGTGRIQQSFARHAKAQTFSGHETCRLPRTSSSKSLAIKRRHAASQAGRTSQSPSSIVCFPVRPSRRVGRKYRNRKR